uniref:Mitotic-spindle organizing protein 1 n=1 Tax=Drosophila rhopaloa TaxID=1041015 RepID=A0A6P4FK64_DRORH
MSENLSSERDLIVLHAMSQLVNAGLSKESLKICIELIKVGIEPGLLATVIKNIREEIKDEESDPVELQSKSEDLESKDVDEPCPPTHRTI